LGRKTEDDNIDDGLLGRSTHHFHERDPETQAKYETRKKYTYAAFLLALSLVSFTVQTETAVYIQHQLKWEKPYCMLYMTHGSWVVLWPATLFLLRLQHWNEPWPTFWRRHVQLLRQTALMVQHQNLHPTPRQSQVSPVPYMLKMTAFITCALTLAGGSWYVAVNQTTASDLTAIYNCSAFFAYAFSIPILHEKVRASKIIAVAIAIIGVFVVAYGDTSPAKHGSKSGGGAGGDKAPPSHEAENRAFGNLIIGIGSVLYGLYEVLYKRLACPPEGAAPDKGVIFANLFGSLIGAFTLGVLWMPLPFLHYMGWELFELPHGEQAWMMAISVLANASMSPFIQPQNKQKYRILTPHLISLLRILPRTYLPYLTRPLLRRSSPHHLHRRTRRSASAPAAQLASYTCSYCRWSAHHWCIYFAVLGVVQRDG
jgi:drug/metabolite transporter (DMT)-like permease